MLALFLSLAGLGGGPPPAPHWGALTISGGGFVADEERWVFDRVGPADDERLVVTRTAWSRLVRKPPRTQVADSATCPVLKTQVARLEAVSRARPKGPVPLETVYYDLDIPEGRPLLNVAGPLRLHAENSGAPVARWAIETTRRLEGCWSERPGPLAG